MNWLNHLGTVLQNKILQRSLETNMSSETKKNGFTIIEVLTVISIITIIITLMVPSVTAARRYAKNVVQKGQFHDIAASLEVYKNEFQDYPDSYDNAQVGAGNPYCGAMKLCEALMGKDGLGLNTDSKFMCTHGIRDYGMGVEPLYAYANRPSHENLRNRHNRYLGRTFRRYGITEVLMNSAIFQCRPPYTDEWCEVISDAYHRFRFASNSASGGASHVGMPVLYYKATSHKTDHDPNSINNVYNPGDNQNIIEETWPNLQSHEWSAAKGGPAEFYADTRDESISLAVRSVPQNPDSYILVSAGWDGLYGTKDDIFNFTQAK